MPIIEPFTYATEERLRIPVAGNERVIVVSGYADFAKWHHDETGSPTGNDLRGAEIGDEFWIDHTVHMVVGPTWTEIIDVSPIVNVAGISFRESDETDDTGYEIVSCKWDSISLPEPDQAKRRVRLKVGIRLCGGFRSSITILSYHLVIRGTIASISG